MKYFLIFIIAIILINSCKKDDIDIYKNEKFANNIANGTHDFVLGQSPDSIYSNGQLLINLDEKIGRTLNYHEPVYFYFYFDSVTVLENGNSISVSYEFIDKDSLYIYPQKSYTMGSKLKITIWASWYTKGKAGTNYTNGEEVFFGLEKEELVINVKDKAIKTLSSFKETTFDNTVYTVPNVITKYLAHEPLKHIKFTYGDQYKYDLEYSLTSSEGESILLNEVVTESIVYLTYEGTLDEKTKYTCNVTANWYVKHLTSDWIACDDCSESIENEYTTSGEVKIDITNDDFSTTYPLYRQVNYLKNEYDKGYFIPENQALNNYLKSNNIVVLLKDLQSVTYTEDILVFNDELNIFEFPLPGDILDTCKIYKIELAEESNRDNVFYSYHFRTSMYSSFEEKWAVEAPLSDGAFWRNPDTPGTKIMNVWPVNERFDAYESMACHETYIPNMPIIQFSAHIPDSWKESKQYQIYLLEEIEIKRDDNGKKYAIPPVDAIKFCSYPFYLGDAQIEGEEFVFDDMGHNWTWNVAGQMYTDYDKNRSQAGAALDSYKDLSEVNTNSNLSMDISYVLPGIDLATTTMENYEIK